VRRDWSGAQAELGQTGQSLQALSNSLSLQDEAQRSGGNPAKFAELLQQNSVTARAYLDDHPLLQIVNQLVLDPWNLVSPELLFEMGGPTTKAGQFEHLALVSRANYKGKVWTLKNMIGANALDAGVLETLMASQPTWMDLTRLNWGQKFLEARFGQYGVPQDVLDGGYLNLFTKNVTAKTLVRIGRGAGVTDRGRLPGDPR
jgi:hypothetical protein